MFIGHFAVGVAAKRALPRVPLPLLFAAVQLADILWPVLIAIGLEQVRIDPGNTAFTPLDFVAYPYSHSLLTMVVWGAILGVIAARVTHGGPRTASLLAALVVSHWVLDWLTHRRDMPLYPGGPKAGLGLWNSIPATLGVELAMFAAGLWIYARTTKPIDRAGTWGLAALVVFLLAAYLSSIGSPPPSVTAVWSVSILGAVVIVVWAWWLDRHRRLFAGAA